jgi:hypothetical protein
MNCNTNNSTNEYSTSRLRARVETKRKANPQKMTVARAPQWSGLGHTKGIYIAFKGRTGECRHEHSTKRTVFIGRLFATPRECLGACDDVETGETTIVATIARAQFWYFGADFKKTENAVSPCFFCGNV